MSENFDVIVSIRDELKRELILGLKARPAIALILGFSGYRHQVNPVMKTLSHTTRAYFINADGLSAFVKGFDISMGDVYKKSEDQYSIYIDRFWLVWLDIQRLKSNLR